VGAGAAAKSSEPPLTCAIAPTRYYIVQSAYLIKEQGWRSLLRLHAVMHNLNLVFYVLVWATRALSFAALPPASSIAVFSNRFYDLGTAIGLKSTAVHFASLNVFLAWFRLVSFLACVCATALLSPLSSASLGARFAPVCVVTLVVLPCPRYIPRFALVTGTLARAASGVGGFVVVFCVVLFGAWLAGSCVSCGVSSRLS